MVTTIVVCTLAPVELAAVVVGLAICGATVGIAADIANQVREDTSWDDLDIGEIAIAGAASSISAEIAILDAPVTAEAIANATISGVATKLEGYDWKSSAESFLIGGIAGGLGGSGAIKSFEESGILGLSFGSSRADKIFSIALKGLFKSTAGADGYQLIKLFCE